METYTVSRTGLMPLSFPGDLVARADGRPGHSDRRQRWHSLALYRTAGGAYVATCRYASTWPGEPERADAWVCETPADVAGVLRAHDSCAHVGGYPPLPRYQDLQRVLVASVRGRYLALVSDLLRQAGREFTEVVP